jgi:hypothetical protein
MQNLSLKQWIIIVAAILLFLTLCIGAYGYGRLNPAKSILQDIDARYQAAIEAKDRIIEQKDNDLKASETRYNQLKASLSAKKQEAAAIKPPQTSEEMRKRYETLGYSPK